MAMDVAQLAEQVEKLNYLLAKISKYLKNNQYVYLRAFDSWHNEYNAVAALLNADKTLSVPVFKLSPIDYSPTGKSIRSASVEKFIKTINHQLIRLEDKIEELNKTAEEKRTAPRPLENFFHRDGNGDPVEPTLADKRVFVAIPAGEVGLKLFWQGIQPALEAQGLSFFRADSPLQGDDELAKLCQELYSCRLAVLNLAGQAPNVMLALGLAYGIGKPVVILQPQTDPPLGEMHNSGYLRYAGAAEIKKKLGLLLPTLLES